MGVVGVASKIFFALIVIQLSAQQTNAAISGKTRKLIRRANNDGPYLGIVIPNLFEMNPLLNHPDYNSTELTIDVSGICICIYTYIHIYRYISIYRYIFNLLICKPS